MNAFSLAFFFCLFPHTDPAFALLKRCRSIAQSRIVGHVHGAFVYGLKEHANQRSALFRPGGRSYKGINGLSDKEEKENG